MNPIFDTRNIKHNSQVRVLMKSAPMIKSIKKKNQRVKNKYSII